VNVANAHYLQIVLMYVQPCWLQKGTWIQSSIGVTASRVTKSGGMSPWGNAGTHPGNTPCPLGGASSVSGKYKKTALKACVGIWRC